MTRSGEPPESPRCPCGDAVLPIRWQCLRRRWLGLDGGAVWLGGQPFGDTEGTWNASTVAQYRTGNGAWLFGYRYLNAEFEAGGSNTHITMSGPEIGHGFRF